MPTGILGALLLGAALLAVGLRLVDLLGIRPNGRGDHFSLAVLLGYATGFYASFAALALDLLDPIAVAGTAAGGVIWGRHELRRLVDSLRLGNRNTLAPRIHKLALTIGTVYLSLYAFILLAPPTYYDNLWIHLYLPKLYGEARGFVERPDLAGSRMYAFVPLLASGYAVGGSVTAGWLLIPWHAAMLCAVRTLCRTLMPDRDGSYGVLSALCLPLLGFAFRAGSNDFFIALPLLLGAGRLANWCRTSSDRDLISAAGFLGLAIAIKIMAVTVIPFAVGVTLARLMSGDRRAGPTGPVLLGCILLLAAPSLPLWIRSYQDTGNPVFPQLGWLFGTRDLNPELVETGVTGPGDLLRVIYNLLVLNPCLGSLGMILAPWSLLGLWRNRIGLAGGYGWGWIACAATGLGGGLLLILLSPVCYTLDTYRYVIPFLLLTAPFTEAAAEILRRDLPGGKTLLALAIALHLVQPSATLLVGAVRSIPVNIGREEIETYLEREVSGYSMMREANRRLGPAHRLLLIDPRGYYIRVPHLSLEPHHNHVPLWRYDAADLFFDRIRELGVTHILYARADRINQTLGTFIRFTERCPDALSPSRLLPLADDGIWVLAEVVGAKAPGR